MKVWKKRKQKLSKDERKIGNFIYKVEDDHIKIRDINGNMTHRMSKIMNIGRMIEVALKEGHDDWLLNYALLTWEYSNMVADEQFFVDIDRACVDCVNRNKELYGIKEDISAEEDKEILEEVRQTYEAIEELKKEEANEDSE